MRRQQGFSYVIVMFMVAILAIMAVRALEITRTRERRDKEEELLLVGSAYRNAIAMYYQESLGSAKSFPKQLDDLLYDGRLIRPERPLRKLFRDPVTGTTEWGVVRNEDGFVIGVYSLSAVQPFKQNGFGEQLQSFEGAQHYSDWKFVYQP